MRCVYLSDLHLEAQDFPWRLKGGDVLIIAGDLCHARALDPARRDRYCQEQRTRVMRFMDGATAAFPHVLLVAGNHEHYDGVFEDTVSLLRRHLPAVTVLDDEEAEISGHRFFGTTLWSDHGGGDGAAMAAVSRRVGEYFFVKTRREGAVTDRIARLRPEDTLHAHRRSLEALLKAASTPGAAPCVVVSHHAPSLKGLNPVHAGNGLDGAYASALDGLIATLGSVRHWVHGHTHIRKQYRIGDTAVHVNCRGFDGRDRAARLFTPTASFDLS